MGIKGLFSYIQTYVESALEWHKLHDCKLVIDGSNLAYDLYNFGTMNSAFGGDYDKYATYVERFFRKLLQCNVEPIVVMDGGRPIQRDKFRTVFKRMKNQIDNCYKVNPDNSNHFLIFPIMGRAVFVNVIQKLGINVLQCDFEADDEIVVIAKRLKAYVLSNDSDFYLFNVPFILLNSVNMKCIQKEKSNSGKNIVKFIPCHRFNHEIFSEITGIKPELMPMLGPILGNDFMPQMMLKEFYMHIRHLQPMSRLILPRHRIIISVVKWLSQETGSPSVVLQKVFNISKGTLTKSQRKLIRSVLFMYFPSESNLEPWVDHHNSECPSLKGNLNISSYASSAISRVNFKQHWFVPPKVKWELDCTCGRRADTNILHGRKLPDWFTRAFRLHLIPPIIPDILNKNYMFSIPQIEMTNRESVYLEMEYVVSGIRGILWSTLAQSFKMQYPTIQKSLAAPEEGFFLKNLGKSKLTGYKDEVEYKVDDTNTVNCDVDSSEDVFVEEQSDEEERMVEDTKRGSECDSMERDLTAEDEVEKEEVRMVEDVERNSGELSAKEDGEEEYELSSLDGSYSPGGDVSEGEGEDDKEEFSISGEDDDDNAKENEKAKQVIRAFQNTKKIPAMRWYIRKNKDLWGKEFDPVHVSIFRTFPTLFDVERLTVAEKKKAFYQVIGFEITFKEELPQNVEFILFCICVWKCKHRTHVSKYEIFSVLMCVLMFCVIDGKLGRTRQKKNLENVIESSSKKVKSLLKSQTLPDPASMSVAALIQSLTQDECQMANLSLYQFHNTDPSENRKTYSRLAMHAFSEYQATVFYLQTLNSLLCFPFPSINVDSFWSGTFCYNIRKCFLTNLEIGDILSALFKKNTRIIELFTKLCNLVRPHTNVPGIVETTENVSEVRLNKVRGRMKRKLGLKTASQLGLSSKRKRKKKKTEKKGPEVPEYDAIENPTEDDLVMMAENRYSALLIS